MTSTEVRLSSDDTGEGVEQHIFARNFNTHPEIIMGLQILDDQIRKVMHVDDDFADTEGPQASEGNFEEGAPGEFDQRLRAIVR